MTTGTAKWLNPSKGFGFIAPANGASDVFVHASAVEKAGLGTLTDCQQIQYEVVSERGRSAAGNLQAV